MHETGKKIGVPSEFVLAIQEYFGLQYFLSFGHPNIFLVCQFLILACHWHLAQSTISHPALGTILPCNMLSNFRVICYIFPHLVRGPASAFLSENPLLISHPLISPPFESSYLFPFYQKINIIKNEIFSTWEIHLNLYTTSRNMYKACMSDEATFLGFISVMTDV